jgi:fructose-1-phosphate kinase PfkB-like protein
MGLILATGLNPAWQRTLNLASFRPGEVNRAESVALSAAGKGVNFARAAKTWGRDDCIVAQFAGGYAGLKLMGALDDEGIKHLTRKVDAQTRICTTILSEADPRMTELIEPAGLVPDVDSTVLLKAAVAILLKADALAVCGSYPPGVGEEFYGTLAEAAAKTGKLTLVDSVMALNATLPHLTRGMLKLNLDELRKITGAASAQDALKAGLDVLKAPALGVTDGPRSAWFADASGLYSLELPALDGVESPLGAGDVCSAVTLSELLHGAAPLDAFVFGLAAASASCLTRKCAVFDKDRAYEIKAGINAISRPWV